MRKTLTDISIRALPVPHTGQYEAWDATLPSFGIRVSKGGSKTFVLKRKNVRQVLGRFPSVTLKQARGEAHRRIALKYFPERSIGTQIAIAEYLQAKKKDLRPSSYYRFEYYLGKYLTTTQQLSTLTAPDFYKILNPLPKSLANLAFAIFKAFLAWCREHGFIDNNPLQHRKPPHKRTIRTRLLSDSDIMLIWRASYNQGVFGSIVRSLVLSGQRRSQITQFNPAWLSTDTISFPASAMKSKQQHIIPVSTRLHENLPQLTSPFHADAAGMNVLRAQLPDIPHWTLHDFRRYFSSTMSKLKVPIDITEALLAHTAGSRTPIQRIYDLDTRLPQMREALERYENHLFTKVLTAEHAQPGSTLSTS